jgi:hypothetical protein
VLLLCSRQEKHREGCDKGGYEEHHDHPRRPALPVADAMPSLGSRAARRQPNPARPFLRVTNCQQLQRHSRSFGVSKAGSCLRKCGITAGIFLEVEEKFP